MSQSDRLSKPDRPALNSFALYLLSLAALIGIYSLYAKFLVPMIEGPPNIVKRTLVEPRIDSPASQHSRTVLTKLLPADAWEHGDCKTLLTQSGTIVFQQFEPVEGGYVEIFPFTLLASKPGQDTNGASDSSSPPTVLRCLRGARLKFDKPAAQVFSGKAKMESARLVGQVDIFRPASGPGANDAVSITTSNIQIDQQKMFTIDEVTFAFGSHRGQGKNLLIEFARNPKLNPVIGDFSSIQGVKRMELAFLDHLRIEPHSSNKLPSGDPAEPLSVKTTNDPLNIRCQGPFVFDFETYTAAFEDEVVVELENPFRDTMQCDQLMIYFDERSATTTPPTESSSETGNLSLRKLKASGRPAVIFSAGRETKITGDLLHYDVTRQMILCEQAAVGGQPVTVVSPDYHVVASGISYQLQEDASLGPIDAAGPGKMLKVANEKQQEFFVEWTERLTAAPNDSQTRISLLGDCRIRMDDQTSIKSQQLDFWLNQIEVATPQLDGSTKTMVEYQPSRLIAHQNVEVVSARLSGTTNQLTANWPTASLQVRRPQYPSSTSNPGRNFRDSPTGMQPLRRNNQATQTVAPAGFDEEVTITNQKFSFQANEVNVNLVSKNEETQIQELSASGKVSITEVSATLSQNGEPPLTIKGDSMRFVPQPDERVRLLVTGTSDKPATVAVKTLRLEGQQLNLDQTANKLWVEGAGKMSITIPPQKNKRANASTTQVAPQDSQNQSDKTSYESVDVTWHGGMVFDGAKVYFEDDVEMSATGKNKDRESFITKSTSEGLSLQLKKPLDFRNLEQEPQQQNIEMEEVVIVDQIAHSRRIFKLVKNSTKPNHPISNPQSKSIISHQTFSSDGNPIQRQTFETSQATMNAGSGKVNAKGPGVMMHYGLGKSQLLESRNGSTAASTQPDGITFIRVNFDGSADASTNAKEMLIRGNVRTLYASVRSFDEILDPDLTTGQPNDSVRVTCEQLKIAQWTPRNATEPSRELLATGNAHIVGTTFEATADRVSYNQSTDILVVEGTPRSDANLWFKQTPNSIQRDHLVAGKILYRLSDKWTEVQSVKNIGINRK